MKGAVDSFHKTSDYSSSRFLAFSISSSSFLIFICIFIVFLILLGLHFGVDGDGFIHVL